MVVGGVGVVVSVHYLVSTLYFMAGLWWLLVVVGVVVVAVNSGFI